MLSRAVRQDIAQFAVDPYGFVMYAFPWGVPGTILADYPEGPDVWQREELIAIGEEYVEALAFPHEQSAIQRAIASGHGIGKSAFMSWLILWFMSTQQDATIVATANTRTQLMTKLWRELARWHNLAINKDWFTWTATSFYHNDFPSTWKADAIPWSEQNSEAFAGLHAEKVMLLYDEASAIADIIFEVSQGALTTPGAIWVATGNPTRNTGHFREVFPGGRFAHRWTTRNVDSRTAKMTNKRQLEEWLEDYGEDSDFARVRVKGEFPRAATTQFIPSDIVDMALGRVITGYESMPRVLGVDVARFGDDDSVIVRRHGTRVEQIDWYNGLDTMVLAAKVDSVINEWAPDAIFVDGVGLGAGVVDRLRQMNRRVFDVQAAAKANDENAYFNKRAEMWGNMRDWLKGEVSLPNEKRMRSDLIGIEYGFDTKNRIQLESKKDMKKRGLPSPDWGDALALTFAEPAYRKDLGHPRKALRRERSLPHGWRVI